MTKIIPFHSCYNRYYYCPISMMMINVQIQFEFDLELMMKILLNNFHLSLHIVHRII